MGGLLSGTFGCAPRGKAVVMRRHVRRKRLYVHVSGAKGKVTGRGLAGVFSHCGVLSGFRIRGGGNVSPQGKLKLTVYRDVIGLLSNRVRMADMPNRVAAFRIALPTLIIAATSIPRRDVLTRPPMRTSGGPIRLRGVPTACSPSERAVVVVSSSPSVL